MEHIHTSPNGQDVSRSSETGSSGFYREGSPEEALRLDLMAQTANYVSSDMIRLLVNRMGAGAATILDVGAGDSPRLGVALSQEDHRYIPVDMRQDAVSAQAAAGFDALQSIATELTIETDSVDLIHARFTWAWLSDTERMLSLAEMMRVGHDTTAISIIDYDWSSIEGPRMLLDMVYELMDTMRQTGFEPHYGARVADDVRDKLEYLVEGPHEVAVMRHATYDGLIESGIDQFISPTVHAIATQLAQIGKVDESARLIENLDALRAYAAEHPEEHIHLPDIVAAGVVIERKTERLTQAMITHLDARDGGSERRDYDTFEEGTDYQLALPDIPATSKVVVATSDAMIHAARRIQTTAYYKDEIIGFDAVGEDGVLVGGNDPMELVRRSVYFIPLNEQTKWMNGVVRIIYPTDEAGQWSLPTIQRLTRHSPEFAERLKTYPFMADDERAVEVSGLAKNMLGGSLEDVMLAMVVLAEFSVRSGHRYGVMGLQDSKVKLIEHLFGTQAIRRIEGQEATHHIDLPGVKEGTLFVPLYVDGATFVEDVYRHASQRQGALFAALTHMTHEILASRDLTSD